MKIHAHTWYGDKVKLEVIGLVRGKRQLIKSDVLPYDRAMENLKHKILVSAIGVERNESNVI